MAIFTDGEKFNATKLNSVFDDLVFADAKAKLTYDSSATATTISLEPTTTNNRLALHVYPLGTPPGEWASLIALFRYPKGTKDQEVCEWYYDKTNNRFNFNTFKSNAGTCRDVVFCCQAGDAGDALWGEVARMQYNTGAGTARFKVSRLQIPNAYPIKFVDTGSNENGQIYLYNDDHFVIESTTGDLIRLATSAASSGASISRVEVLGGTAQGLAGVKVYENLKMQIVGAKYQSTEFPVKAGTLSDADFNDPQNGLIGLDSTDGRIYFRHGGNWHYVNQTAGFEIPKEEKNCPICKKPIRKGQFVCGMIDSKKKDGALHGLYVHLKCAK